MGVTLPFRDLLCVEVWQKARDRDRDRARSPHGCGDVQDTRDGNLKREQTYRRRDVSTAYVTDILDTALATSSSSFLANYAHDGGGIWGGEGRGTPVKSRESVGDARSAECP